MKCDVFNIWAEHMTDLKNYASKRVRNTDDVNDILQSVLIKFTKYCETKNDVKNFKGWLYRITHNAIIDFYKQSNLLVKSEPNDLAFQDNQGNSENIFIWLHYFIDSLPAKYSVPLKLHDLERKPQKEIADLLDLTLEATKSRILRARKMLKNKFEECGVIEHSENQLLYTITKPCCLS